MKYLPVFLTITLSFLAISSPAETVDSETTKNQIQLQSLLKELELSAKKRQQQNQKIEQLNRKLECNLSLIHAYNDCETRFKNDSNKRLECTQKAKKTAANCLNTSAVEKKSGEPP